MRKVFVLAMALMVALSTAISLQAARGRKLPVGAYIKSAKIDIISGDLDRYPEAIAMLDSLFMHYGPHAEALSLMYQIQVDYMERESNPKGKLPYVEKMVAYMDSLHMCCENEDIKDSYRDDCDEYLAAADSTRVYYWREFFNAGAGQYNEMIDLNAEKAETSDSSLMAYYDSTLQAKFDTCVANMEIAMTIDSTQNRTYIALGGAYQEAGLSEEALKWKGKGMAAAPNAADSASLAISIGYDYVNMGKYCEAIPFLETYLDHNMEALEQDRTAEVDTVTLYNITICYNNCGMYDSALQVYHKLLELNPAHLDALNGIGRYYNEMGRRAGDSMSAAGDDSLEVARLKDERDRLLDSAKIYFGRVFEADPNETVATEMYAVLSAIDLDFENAARAFEQLTRLQPTNANNWVALGDCYLNLENYEESIAAYEKAVELTPTMRDLWEQLEGLYKQVNDKAKAAEAAKKIQELK